MKGSVTTHTAMLLFALVLLGTGAPAYGQEVERLDETCVATILNRTVRVSPEGTFALGNVPIPFGPFRARVVCDRESGLFRAQSDLVFGVPNGETPLGPISMGEDEPIPIEIFIAAPTFTLTPEAISIELFTVGRLPDGTLVDLTSADTGTAYLTSNPVLATISEDGVLTGLSSGRVQITALHEGVIAAAGFDIALSGDSDGDGLPDDFEALNAQNPGGSNLARLTGAMVNASSSSVNFPVERAVDGSLQTSWFTAVGDAANQRSAPFIEVILPSDQRVAQVRLLGNRENPDGFDIFAGFLEVFDGAGGLLLETAELMLPGPVRDLSIPVDLDGVRRVRFTSTDDESNTPGLSEIQVVARPGGPALNPADAGDASADFDQDGLTNLEEFELGTSIFLNDTDGDGILDAVEADLGSSPVLADSDADGLIDGEEANPTADTDGDGLVNIVDADADNDGLPDGLEVRLGLNPLRTDSNFNGLADGSEDSDGDGLVNGDEVLRSTDAGDPDSDGDGLFDGEEVVPGDDGFLTDPRRPDSDGDGMFDGYESVFGLDPTDPSDAGQDPDGDGLTNLEEFELGTDPRNADRVPPRVAEISPADGAVDHPVNEAVVVRFTEALQEASVTAGVVRVSDGLQPVPGTVALSVDGLSVTFDPAVPLASETLHTVEVDGVRDLAGNLTDVTFTSSFTTGVFVDTVRPFAVRTSPLNGQVDVPVNVPFEIEFSERLDPSTLTTANFRLRDEVTFQDVGGMIQVDPDGRTASFVPDMSLPIGRRHRVILSTNIQDAAGNRLSGSTQFVFTTAFAPDNARPVLLGTSPIDGDGEVPVNALVMLDFDEPVSLISVLRGIRVEADGEPVAGSFALSDGNRRVTFTSLDALASTTIHRIVVTTQVTDAVGNPVDNSGSRTFVTGAAGDVTRPRVSAVEPVNGAVGISLGISVVVTFDERVNALTVTPSSFFVETDFSPVVAVPGTVAVAADRLSATFTPSAPLVPNTKYRVRTFNAITDLAGQTLASTSVPSRFTTGFENDLTAPSVAAASPPDGAADVPVNARVTVIFDEPMSPLSVGESVVELSSAAGPVTGSLSLANDRRTLTFVPDAPLAAATEHTVAVSGATDQAGNPSTPFASAFTTSPSTAADTSRPRAVAVDPANGSTDVDVTTPIVIGFDELLDPTSVTRGSVPITVSGFSGTVAGSYAVAGDTVTFTPSTPLPGGRRVNVQVNSNVRDLAGNGSFGLFSRFDTSAAQADTTPPEVLLVSPVDGATDVGRSAAVVLTFSESLDASTLNASNFALFAGGGTLSTSVSRSSDNQTVTLSTSAPLPAGRVVTALVTDDVRDLSGNRLADFRASFTTVPATDAGRPSVVNQRPANGARGVPLDRPVVLYVNEDLDASTVPGAFFVSQNGDQAPGEVRVTGNGRAIEFVPDFPWERDAIIQIFLTPDARDVSGNSLNNYSGSFRTVTDTSGSRASVTRLSPPSNAGGVPVNAVIEIEYNEPLDPTTLALGSTVFLRRNVSGLPAVDATVSLVRGGRVIRIEPAADLAPETQYRYDVTSGVLDLDGAAVFGTARFFTTGAGPDLEAPEVERVSPPDGAAGVALNAHVRLRFSEPVNPLSVTDLTVALGDAGGDLVSTSISFSNSDRDVLLTPNSPLAAASVHMVLIDGVQDAAGNTVTVTASTFTTGAEPDTARPVVTRRSPFANAADVPVNAVVSVELDEPVDPVTVTASSFFLRDEVTFQQVPGTVSLAGGDRIVSFVPDAPLAVGRRHVLFVSNRGITDLSNNRLNSGNFAFTTALSGDAASPAVVTVSPEDGLAGVPINARVEIRFDEPVQSFAVDGVTLSAGGADVAVSKSFSDANRRLILTPVDPLDGETVHTLTIAGARDLAGNEMASPHVTTFVTETGADLVRPRVTLIDPLNGSAGVGTRPIVRIVFSERMSRPTVTTSDFFVETDFSPVVPAAGTVTVAADGRSAVWVADAPLLPGTDYRVRTFSGMTDLTGRTLASTSVPARFTTGGGEDTTPPAVVATSPPDGAADVPVNSPVKLRLGEPLSAVNLADGSLVVSAAGVPVGGAVEIDGSRTLLTFTPAGPLAAATAYTVEAAGFTDLSGNVLVSYAGGFTTSSSAADDTVRPRVIAVSPANGAVEVDVATPIVLDFDETVDPTSVSRGSVPITVTGFSGTVAGAYAVAADTVTFTPSSPLPPGRRVNVQVNSGLRDLAGNGSNFFSSSFVTSAAEADTTPPEVILVSPADGATGIGQGAAVVLTFSESLDASTLNTNSFALLAGVTELSISVSRSSDNRTVTLSSFGPLPAATVVTVVATDDVRDLSGNRLADFRASFTTLPPTDAGRPSVVNQRPANGASGVPLDRNVVLYVDEDLDAATVAGSLVVSEDGVEVTGETRVTGNGRAIEFVPDVPWRRSAIVQVFLTDGARDVAGNRLVAYSGSFRTVTDTSATRASLVRLSPSSNATGVPVNAAIELEYNEPLDPSTLVLGSTVFLRQNVSGLPAVDATVSLVRGGRVIRIEPVADLAPGTQYRCDVTSGVLDLDGAPVFGTARFFTTGTAADLESPAVDLVSPPDGAADVALNAHLRLRFSEPVNPLTVTETTVAVGAGGLASCSINFSSDNREVLVTSNSPLAAGTVYMVLIDGVEDLAGNSVTVTASTFTSGSEPDTVRPVVTRSTPFANAADVPVNAVISMELDEPIDPLTVTTTSVFLREEATFQQVPGAVSLSGGDRIISFLPDAPLAVDLRHVLFIANRGITDLSNNRLNTGNFSFTTSASGDADPPQVLGVSPEDGFVAAPINTRVEVRFDEPVQSFATDGVTLALGGLPVAVSKSLADANRRLVLTPALPLASESTYTVTIDAVRDLAGNVLAAPVTTSFVTEAGADIVRPSVILVDPANNATEVPTDVVVRIAFNSRMNKLTVTAADFFVETDAAPNTRVEGTVTVAADGASAVFEPAAPLDPGIRYRVRTFSGMTDLAGQTLASTSLPVRFDTGAGGDVTAPSLVSLSPPDGTGEVPANGRVRVLFDEPIATVSAVAGGVTLSSSGMPVMGGFSFSGDRRTVVFTPAAPLDSAAAYDVDVDGVVDLSANAAAPVSASFETNATPAVDIVRPSVASVDPANGTTGVDRAAPIVVTFDEPVDPTSVSEVSMPMTVSGVSGTVAGTYAVSGATVTFTPDAALPADAQINVRVNSGSSTGVFDFVGNPSNFFSSFFRTAP